MTAAAAGLLLCLGLGTAPNAQAANGNGSLAGSHALDATPTINSHKGGGSGGSGGGSTACIPRAPMGCR